MYTIVHTYGGLAVFNFLQSPHTQHRYVSTVRKAVFSHPTNTQTRQNSFRSNAQKTHNKKTATTRSSVNDAPKKSNEKGNNNNTDKATHTENRRQHWECENNEEEKTIAQVTLGEKYMYTKNTVIAVIHIQAWQPTHNVVRSIADIHTFYAIAKLHWESCWRIRCVPISASNAKPYTATIHFVSLFGALQAPLARSKQEIGKYTARSPYLHTYTDTVNECCSLELKLRQTDEKNETIS